MGIQYENPQIYKGGSSSDFQIVQTSTSTMAMKCDFCSLKNNNEPSNGEISECPFCDYHSKVPPDLQPMQDTNFTVTEELTNERRKFQGRFECNVCAGNLERRCAFCNYYHVEDDELGVYSTAHECTFCSHKQGISRERIKTSMNGKNHVFSEGRSSLSKEEDLDKRFNSAKGRFQYKCKECPFSCMREYVLKRHEQNHLNRTTVYPCPFCPRTSKTREMLRYHLMTHTGETPYECNYCSYSASRWDTLKIHERTHTGEKPYKCKFCSFSASQRSALKTHERTHTGEKPYRCKYCNFSASRRGTLIIHERTHTGEKPYKCNYCSFSAAQLGALRLHKRTHTGDKPFNCQYCEYRCVRSAYLLVHERRHTGEKPYKCSHCTYTCVDASDLRKHERNHTGDKPYRCQFCEYRCTGKTHLRVHQRQHRGTKLRTVAQAAATLL